MRKGDMTKMDTAGRYGAMRSSSSGEAGAADRSGEGRSHQYSQGRKPSMKDTQDSAKSTTDNASAGFTDEERAAIQARAREVKAGARRGPRADKEDGESAVLAKIAEMTES